MKLVTQNLQARNGFCPCCRSLFPRHKLVPPSSCTHLDVKWCDAARKKCKKNAYQKRASYGIAIVVPRRILFARVVALDSAPPTLPPIWPSKYYWLRKYG
ncbi:unnamed protein product [Amoebophrya sp. A120]|nr:unnamed protein product [Amoebophrya sp. A120]|eukprot:GSA120T00026084001.1